jgi:hypothetical protein
MSPDRDPAPRNVTRRKGVGSVALVCVATMMAAVVVAYVLVTRFVLGG